MALILDNKFNRFGKVRPGKQAKRPFPLGGRKKVTSRPPPSMPKLKSLEPERK